MKKIIIAAAMVLAFSPICDVLASDSDSTTAAEPVSFIGSSWDTEEVSDEGSSNNNSPFETGRFSLDKIKQFDTDGDGTLSDTEKVAMKNAREAEMLTKFDTDGDGTLSDTEKEAMMKDRPGKGGRPPMGEGRMPAEMLAKFDTDGDGTLSDTEKAAMKTAMDAEMLKKFDTDGDGTLSDTEKETMMKDRPGKGGRPPMGEGKMPAEMLAKFDTDGDGTLSDAEKAAMKTARETEMLTKFDTDGDGTLSDTEKETMKQSRPGREKMGGKGKGPGKRRMERGKSSN